MKLIDQHTKKIMEGCKDRAREAGLRFDNESLEYIITNKDMNELSPKVMIPTLYDYWVHDVEILKQHGKYKLYPSNPYETVINSRPAISFYNDNNPDWMNIMIFYHVIAHVDFFQNNILYEDTWNDDFVGQALADKRLIEQLRCEHGRWVDYVIEFSRSIDNIVGYFDKLAGHNLPNVKRPSEKIDFYFDVFLQEILKLPSHEIYKEVERYNGFIEQNRNIGESMFFSTVITKHPEFQAKFDKHIEKKEPKQKEDIMQFIAEHSPLLKKEENDWMKAIMTIIRNTSLYFSPQIRTKITNEGWASYWHDLLFLRDDRIIGHEVGYAKLNAGVTSISRVGLNPYAIGLRLIQYVEELANKGRLNFEYQKIKDYQIREKYDQNTGTGKDSIFDLRSHFSDFMLINTFVDQDFVDAHELFVVGKRVNQAKGVHEYYVKSKKAEDYKKMLLDSLYHPPLITINHDKTNEANLYLTHQFEGKQLVKDFIPDTLIGIEFLWGAQLQLETNEIIKTATYKGEQKLINRKVLYTVKNKKVDKKFI